ncbi:MAG: DUF6106 family protein [Oscillospiraceae bacterium]|jgi:hypothetical protein|nr:DUF6106 family protein [Oscillospiraceae bacterium]
MADVFIEQIVRKLPDGRTALQRSAIILGIFLVPFAFLYMGNFPENSLLFLLSQLTLPVLVLCVWLGIVLWRRTGLEYEYIFTNGSLDVDVIYGRRSRKRILTVDCSGFEILAPMSEKYANQYNSPSFARVVDAASHRKSGARWFAIFNGKDGKRTLLIFEPAERLQDAFRSRIRSKMLPP